MINLQPDVVQSRFDKPLQLRGDNRHLPLPQPRQHQEYFRDPYPAQYQQQVPYLQQQQNLLQKVTLLIHIYSKNDYLIQCLLQYQVQPQNQPFPKKILRGKNLDEEDDDFQIGNLGLHI